MATLCFDVNVDSDLLDSNILSTWFDCILAMNVFDHFENVSKISNKFQIFFVNFIALSMYKIL